MSGTGEYQATNNDDRLETVMKTLRSCNPSNPQNDTRFSCTQPYQLLFYACERCPMPMRDIEVAATLLEANKDNLNYELCRKIYMLPAHASKPVDWTEHLRWILSPSARMAEKDGSWGSWRIVLYGSVYSNMVEERDYHVLLGITRAALDEKEHRWRTES